MVDAHSDVADLGTMFGAGEVATFGGLPACDNLAACDAAAVIVGIPHATPYISVGSYCGEAPKAIRAAAAPYAASFHHVNFDIGAPILQAGSTKAVDLGDLDVAEETPDENRALIGETVAQILKSGAAPIVLGGDDSIPIPVFDGFAGQGEYCVVQIDAHIDWRDEVDGERNGLSSNMRRASEMEHITNIIQIGQRAIGSGREQDHADAKAWGVHFISGREFASVGVEAVLDAVPEGADVLFNLDIDGLDQSIVPGVIGRAPGGLGYWDVVELIHGVADRGRLAGFNLLEFMPGRDVSGLGANVAAHLVMNAIAAIVQGSSSTT